MLKKFGRYSKFLQIIKIYMVFALIFLLLFFPCVFSLKINESRKIFSGFLILSQKGTLIKISGRKHFLTFPFLLKFSSFLNIFLFVVGVILFKIKKYTASAVFYILSVFSFFLFFISLNSLKKSIVDFNISSNSFTVNLLWPYIFFVVLALTFSIYSISREGKEKLAESIFFCCSITAILIVFSIIIYVLICGLPAILKIGFFNFIFKTEWNPALNKFGILNLIIASLIATLGSIVLAVPLGVFTAIYLSEMANRKIAFLVNPLVEILASIPSVVYGFFGMTVIVPLIKKIFNKPQDPNSLLVVGDSLLAVILVLLIMILPTIISTSFASFKTIPKAFKEASLNLGATKVQTIFKVTLKAAKHGIFSGVTLAFAKAIGETMAVIMVAGNVVNSPHLLKPVRLLTTGIAIDMAYSSGLFRQALFGIGLVLFLLIILINLSFRKIAKNSNFKKTNLVFKK